jgi:transcription initiation factor TFIID TATA-box-binding protein
MRLCPQLSRGIAAHQPLAQIAAFTQTRNTLHVHPFCLSSINALCSFLTRFCPSLWVFSWLSEQQVQSQVTAAASFIPANMYPRVNNIVATVELNSRLSLKSLSDCMNNCEYNPRRFSAVVVRLKNPKATALIFASGKLVVTGSRSLGDLEQSVRMFVRAIRKAAYSACKVQRMTVHNMVASCNIDAPLRLEALCLGLGGYGGGAELDAEIFPGLIYRLQEPTVTMLIFVNGKIVITGAASHSVIIAAFEKIFPVLQLYKRE